MDLRIENQPFAVLGEYWPDWMSGPTCSFQASMCADRIWSTKKSPNPCTANSPSGPTVPPIKCSSVCRQRSCDKLLSSPFAFLRSNRETA